ncbi:NADP-dependent oxidoreductase domain-containing protein 1 [Spinachia spinachia]
MSRYTSSPSDCRRSPEKMMDVSADLISCSFEAELTEEEKEFTFLRTRAPGLTFCGCAHAAFLCKLVHSLNLPADGGWSASGGDGDLRVGILGMGQMGKQLLHTLLDKSGIKPSHIKVSSRRPESAVEFTRAGVECFFDNRRLAAWADVLFLCCLPSHLLKVCAHLRAHLSTRSLVYSFPTGVPVSRLAQLLGHDFILKPQYDFIARDAADVWLSCTRLTKDLRDPLLIEASCPLTTSGGISVGLTWVSAVLYSLLNICTSRGLDSSDALSLINAVLKEKCANAVELDARNFIGAAPLRTDEPFPWISLTDVQTKETPLLRFLSSSRPTQQCLSAAYKSLLCQENTTAAI